MEAPALRVLIGMPFAEPLGGAERLLLVLLAHARRTGLEPTVVLLADGSMRERAEALGARVVVMPVRRVNHPWDAAAAIRASRRLLDTERPDVVLSWHSRAHVYLGPAAWSLSRRPPVVWWQHHVPHRWERLELAATIVPADLIVATSHAAQSAQSALRPRRRMVVVNPGIEEPPPADAPQRRALGLPAGMPVAGIVGRLVRWKGQDRFLRALALLRDRGHDLAALVVGGTAHGLEPDFGPELAPLAERLGISDRVVFCDHVSDPLPYVRACDLLVNASTPEPFGMTLLEAMAVGVPVVAVAQGGPLEIIEDGVSGVLAPDGSPAALADAMARATGDVAVRARLAAAARRRFEEHFTGARMADETARHLCSLVSGRV